MGNRDLFQEVQDAGLPAGTYAIFGSGPLGVRGLKECRDMDVIVTERTWNESASRGWEEKTNENGRTCLAKGNIELWRDWHPGEWDIEALVGEADMIDGLPFVRLEHVLAWKKLHAREKDLKDIEAIEQYYREQSVKP